MKWIGEVLIEKTRRGGNFNALLPPPRSDTADPNSEVEIGLKKHDIVTDNPSIIIYVNTIENRIMFKFKTRYYLHLFTPETMKLLGSPESKITEDKNGENVPDLEMTEIVLILWNTVNCDYQQESTALYTIVPNKSFDQLLAISPKNIYF